MVHNDLSYWPLVITVLCDEPNLIEQQQMFSTFNAALKREQPFATLRIYVNNDSLGRTEGIDQQAKKWNQHNGEKFQQALIGMATVTPSDRVAERMKTVKQKATPYPTKVFAEIREALDWLDNNIFQPHGITFDANGVEALLAKLNSAPNR